jgi:hypothetical protein
MGRRTRTGPHARGGGDADGPWDGAWSIEGGKERFFLFPFLFPFPVYFYFELKNKSTPNSNLNSTNICINQNK